MQLAIPESRLTERLSLRRLRYEDAEEIFYAYASKPEATTYVAWPTHSSILDTRKYLRYAVPAWTAGLEYNYSIRWKETNRLIGGIGVVNDAGKAQLGYVLSPTHWGMGIATEACRAMLEMLRNEPQVYRVGSFVDADNSASSKVLLKCGFEIEARLTKWFRFINQNNQPKDCLLFRIPNW